MATKTLDNILGGTSPDTKTADTNPNTGTVQVGQATPNTTSTNNGNTRISEEESKRVSPAKAIPTTTIAPPVPQISHRIGYEEMFKRLNPYQPPTEQELEKERKKQKREQIFAAIGDGISALSNLYFTTQYAPNMYLGRNTVSQKVKDRWDKLAAERNANMTAYINGLMRARQADDEYANNERAWERQLGLDKVRAERDKAADARAEAEEERKKTLHPFDVRAAEGKAKAAEAEAEYAEEYQRSRIKQNEAAAGASNASASASRSRARYYDSGGSGGAKYYGAFRGKSYKTQADYEKAVLDAAKVASIPIYDEEVVEPAVLRDDGSVIVEAKTKRKKRSIADIAAEVDAKDREKKPNPMGNGGNGKKPNPMS